MRVINAEEHKKMLAQVAELERNSINFFDVEKEFFLITSDNLSEVKTRFYGYSIQASGIYEQDNITEEAIANLDGRGCYVYIEARDGQITIKQDMNGCWGLYLFRYGDYFALSNSFLYMLDHLKFKYPLTVNRDYCHCLIVNDLCSHTYSETAVNEVQLVERNAIVHIDVTSRELSYELINYREQSIALDTEEGIATLDRWVEFWGSIFRGIAQHTKFIETDLTGGFDSRMTFSLLLSSGIDCNKIRIYSIKSSYHTYEEDYDIASKIATHYGFKLNALFPARQILNYSLTDIFNLSFYTRLAIHKASDLSFARKSVDKCYKLTGFSGETMRGNWLRFGSLKKFLEREHRKINPYSLSLADELSDSLELMLKAAFKKICDKFDVDDQSDTLPQYLYQETRCRNHFGKVTLGHYFENNISLSPALDSIIRTLQTDAPECLDPNLLIALIFTRYTPDLVTFPFQGGRSIAPETVEYAKKLNERFLICHKRVDNLTGGIFHLQPRDSHVEQILSTGRNNPAIPNELPQACLKATFESSRTYGLFASYFDTELYHTERNFHFYAIASIAKVLENVVCSQGNLPPYQDVKRFLKEDFCKVHKDVSIPDKFLPYLTVRMEVKLVPKDGTNDFQIVSASDDKTRIIRPDFLQKDGVGYQINACGGELEFIAKAGVDGQISFTLRGIWTKTLTRYWIDYTRLVVNGKTVFDTVTPTWFNKPYLYTLNVKAGEEVKVQVEWLPHRSDT